MRLKKHYVLLAQEVAKVCTRDGNAMAVKAQAFYTLAKKQTRLAMLDGFKGICLETKIYETWES